MDLLTIVGALVALVVAFYIFAAIKSSFDDEATKLFRRIWSCERYWQQHRFEQHVFDQQQRAQHKLFELFGVDFKDADHLQQDAIVNLLTAAHEFDKKQFNSRDIVMLDVLWRALTNFAKSPMPSDKGTMQEKLQNILNVAVIVIGLRKGVAKFGADYDDVIKNFWDEQDDAEKSAWAQEHPNLSGVKLYESFFAEKYREMLRQT